MSLLKILKEAITKEEDAYQSYLEAAETTDDPEARALLMQLAQDELDHQRVLNAQYRLLESSGGIVSAEVERQDYLERRLAEERTENLKLTTELELAASIQQSLLPRSAPRISGLQVAARILMARHVGGDYYDFATDREGRLWAAIGDVAGKGMSASLLMATARAAWKSVAATVTDQGRALEILNHAIYPDFEASSRFMTLFSLFYDPNESVLSYACAGHNPPILLPEGQSECRELSEGGPIMGFLPDIQFAQHQVTLTAGDILVLYTDGLTEARREREFFGEERVRELLIQHRSENADAIAAVLMDEVRKFQGPSDQADDITLVILKRF